MLSILNLMIVGTTSQLGRVWEKAIKITYGHIFKGKQSQVINEFTSFEGAQLVEKGVYRPDLFKTIEDPIVKDEKDYSN